MGDFFDTMTIVVVIIMVFIVLGIAIHASARLLQMTFGKKSGLNRKDTKPENHPERKSHPALISSVPFTRKNTLLVNLWQSGHMSVSSRRMSA